MSYIILYCIILYYIILYHIILCYIILYYIILYYIILYCIILYYIILYHIVSYYIIYYTHNPDARHELPLCGHPSLSPCHDNGTPRHPIATNHTGSNIHSG